MRNVILIALLFMAAPDLMAQKNDYIWLAGYNSKLHNIHDSLINGYTYGNTKLDFNTFPVVVTFDSLKMNFDFTNTTFSDNKGNLLLYSNGIYIANALDEVIENGDSINAGYLLNDWDTSIAMGGYRTPQGILALQSTSDSNQYYLFHSFIDSIPGSFGNELYCSRILMTLVDMSANSGHGKVLFKNETLIDDSIGGEIQAIRHGNGRDWWLLIQKRYSNCYYRVLLDNTGPHIMPDLACLGEAMNSLDIGVNCFTPDGSKYIYLYPDSGLNIYDFDRCTGQLSNARFLPLSAFRDSSWGAYGLSVSPNSRFLYVSATYYLYQFDLWAENIFQNIDTVGIYNGGHFPGIPVIKNVFHMQQLGPDGKIYMSCANTTPYYHVINNPDRKGDSCNFIQNVSMPTLVNSVSSHPNYRLGPLLESACDTLNTMTTEVRAKKERILKIYPNPATDYAIIDYGFTDWSMGTNISLQITDAIGQVIYTQPLPMYSGFQKLDISKFAAGLYNVVIKRGGAIVATTKLVKE